MKPNKKGLLRIGITGFLAIATVTGFAAYFWKDISNDIAKNTQASEISPTPAWAFEEHFNGKPNSPSQDLLPKSFDYVVTHRDLGGGQSAGSHAPGETFPADHSMTDCKAAASADPISSQNPILQHETTATHISDTAHPDASFFICNDHMMSAMGHIDAYSVSAFYPRQEFDFSQGGVLEWDVSLPTGARSWWEVMIVPREQTQLGAARDWLPISETYPKDRMVFIWEGTTRKVEIGTGKPSPDGFLVDAGDWREWKNVAPGDPALTDRRIRRKMRLTFGSDKVDWAVQKPDGTFDTYSVNVPGGLPFKKGLVFFKTHAYTPEKDGNMNMYTYHWDAIRFSGPKLAAYEAYEIPGVVDLNGNGDVPAGTSKTVTLNLPKVGTNPVILGQTRQGMPGHILLSINGSPNIAVAPHSTSSQDDPCYFDGWRTFRIQIDPSLLKVGENTFKWTVGPKPACANGQWWWTGFSVKAFEVQFDGSGSTGPTPTSPVAISAGPTTAATITPTKAPANTVAPTATNTPTRTPTPSPTRTPTPTLVLTRTPVSTNTPTPVPSKTPTPVPSSVTFYKGINMNGNAVSIDNNQWTAMRNASVSHNGSRLTNNFVKLSPETDSARTAMIRSSVWGRDLRINVRNIENGTYDVYIYNWEDSRTQTFTLKVENASSVSVTSGARGSWKKLGPYRVTITDGALTIRATGGDANISGIELYKAK